MKAFKLTYSAPGKTDTITVLAEDDSKVEEALSLKDNKFKVGDGYSKIMFKKEVPLSNVLISELSITEFLSLKNL